MLYKVTEIINVQEKQNNNVHIGNHLYSENQRKRGKQIQQ